MRTRVAWLAVLLVLWTGSASAQEPPAAPYVSHIVKGVVFDPTTYIPGVVMYGAMRLDWESSQVFFRHGFVEHNADFTASGVSDTASLGRRAGNLRIAADSARVILQVSVAHNIAARMVERELTRRYPAHRKLFRVVGRIERIAAASYLSMALSAVHLRQWRRNEELARQLGYR